MASTSAGSRRGAFRRTRAVRRRRDEDARGGDPPRGRPVLCGVSENGEWMENGGPGLLGPWAGVWKFRPASPTKAWAQVISSWGKVGKRLSCGKIRGPGAIYRPFIRATYHMQISFVCKQPSIKTTSLLGLT